MCFCLSLPMDGKYITRIHFLHVLWNGFIKIIDMAKQKGFIKVKGSLGGLTFYSLNREELIRTTGGIDKSRIEKDPNFKRTRENMSEFGGSAKVGKALRTGFSSIIKAMSDSSAVGRITGMMKQVNVLGSGLRGKRAFEILTHKDVIEGFEFNKFEHFESIFYAPYTAPTLDTNRAVATWVIPDFNTSNLINAPEGATHFKFILAATVLSDYTYHTLRGYEPVNVAENEVNGMATSSELPIGGMVGSATTLTVDLGFGAPLPTTVGVVVAVGIQFYQEINTDFYELSSGNALKLVLVG